MDDEGLAAGGCGKLFIVKVKILEARVVFHCCCWKVILCYIWVESVEGEMMEWGK